MKHPWEWDEDDLMALVANGTKESIELDYKQCDSLAQTDGKKNEVSKDVSAFANSAGGTIIYGVVENKHVPVRLDVGYDPSVISKEWLDQVINSRIQRRIDGVRINQVELASTAPGKVAYVVHIPQSLRAPHQAADKKFYKRYNFESVPMEEYEIRDVLRRAETPTLRAFVYYDKGKDRRAQDGFTAYHFKVSVENTGSVSVRDMWLTTKTNWGIAASAICPFGRATTLSGTTAGFDTPGRPLHPGEWLECLRCQVDAELDPAKRKRLSIRFELRVHATDCRPLSFVAEFSKDLLEDGHTREATLAVSDL